MQMSKFNVPRHKINHIFISHLHGDHIFGLPGLLFSYSLNDRKEPLEIHSPQGLEQMIANLLTPAGMLSFPLIFNELNPSSKQTILSNKSLSVTSIPLKHRIPTCGFLFHENPFELNIRTECIQEFGLSIDDIKAVKAGADLHIAGKGKVPNSELTLPPWHSRSFAFLTDTIYDESIVPDIANVDLLYHESTFCEDAEQNAARTMHSTAQQAAQIAKSAKVGKLILGHYSSRYAELKTFHDEATAIFTNTELGLEGKTYEVGRKRMETPA